MADEDKRRGAAGLRRRAEETARKGALLPEELHSTLYELQVHQIELEMQNEELRRTQTELDAARARYFDLYDLAPIGYMTISEKGLILESNLTAAALLGIARGALVKQMFTSFILKADADIYYLHRKRLFDTAEPQACELRMVKADDTVFWAHLDATRAQDDNGESLCRIMLSDITKRKQDNEYTKASLLEKETLLKEIHHRVKNNLQVISSLLNIQASHVQDENAKEALRASMARVRTMSMIHTQLHQSADLTLIDFDRFIRELVRNISQTYARAESHVAINVDADETRIDIETSIPCGLILNELVSNALKHAFPEGSTGHVRELPAKQKQVLTVQDDGVGFLDSIPAQTANTMGLELVAILSRQLNADVNRKEDGGTTWTISFPLTRSKERQNG